MSAPMSLDDLRVDIKRTDLSLEDFHRAINALATNRDSDVPTALSATPVRFDLEQARFYWRAKHSPLSAYQDYRNLLRQRIIDRRSRKREIKFVALAGLLWVGGALLCHVPIHSLDRGGFFLSTVVLSLLCGLGFVQIDHIRAAAAIWKEHPRGSVELPRDIVRDRPDELFYKACIYAVACWPCVVALSAHMALYWTIPN